MFICAGRAKNSCEFLSWTEINPRVLSFSATLKNPLQSGTVYILSLKAENGAGLETTVYSRSAIVDSSPPLSGNVTVGNKKRLVILKEGQPFLSKWQGFDDAESDIKQYEWKICLSSYTSKCLSSFVNIAKKTSLILNAVGIEQGKQYVLIVKAVNNAGLEVEVKSNPFILDKTPPETGMVFDGNLDSKDLVFQSSSSEICVNWKNFKDKESGISRYEVCVGSRPGLCDVRSYANVGLNTKTIIKNLVLTHNTTYYTSTRALNGAGQTGFASSNGITIDLTSPVGGDLHDGEESDVDFTGFNSYVSSNWEEFNDPESNIAKYVICAGSAMGACDILRETVVTSGLSVKYQVWPSIASGTMVYSTLRVYNEAGGVTEVHSDGVLVDTTPPDELGKVEISSSSISVGNAMYLTNRNSLCSSWSGFTDTESNIVHYHFSMCLDNDENTCPIPYRDLGNRTSICIEDPPVTEGVKYFLKIQATNQVGLTSTADSTRFIVDSTEPDTGELTVLNPLGTKFQFISSDLQARWNGFSDSESGIKEYLVCVGTEPGLCDVTELTSVGNITQFTWSGLNLAHNEEYFVSMKAANNADLFSNFTSSYPISVDRTGPDPSEVLDGPVYSKDIDFQRSRRHVSATWFTSEDPESDVIQLTWCVGTRPRSCDLKSRSSLTSTQTKAYAFLDRPLNANDKYYVTLEAVNGAGDRSIMVSDGVVIDYIPPKAGVVIDGNDTDIDFIRNDETIYAHWTVFEDLESGVMAYMFALCEKENITSCPSPFSDIGKERNISLTGTELTNGKKYVVIIRATNMVGLSVDARSDGFRVDSTPPISGNIWILKPERKREYNKISARWNNFFDPESGMCCFDVCLGTSQGDCDVKVFERVGKNTTHVLNDVTLVHMQTYYFTVKAINNAGLSTRAVSEEINIDLTPPEPVKHNSIFSSDLQGVCNTISDRDCDKSQERTNHEERAVQISCVADLIEAKWSKYEDKESGVTKIEWCIETSYDTCNTRGWEKIDVALLERSTVIHSLPSLMSVRVLLRITNGVGNSLILKSSPCNPQQSFPSTIQVNEVSHLNYTDTDIDYQTSVDAILVTWTLANNATRVQAALVAPFQDTFDSLLQLWRGEVFVFEFVDVLPEKNHLTFSGERLKPYTQYRAVVRVWNEIGLYRDFVSDGIIIVPDAPSKLQVNTTDVFLGNEEKRWHKFLEIPSLTRNEIDDTYFVPDPFSVLIDANLQDTNGNKSEVNDESTEIIYKATVVRVTSGENETRNETVANRTIFDHSHIQDEFDVCCSKTNKRPRTVYADVQFKPVKETTLFGSSVAALENDLIVVSSIDSVYLFSPRNAPITLKTCNSSLNDSFLKVKGRNDTVLISGDRSVMLYEIEVEDPVKTDPQVYITNCNYTMKNKAEHCNGEGTWSSSESVGTAFDYDGRDVIVVSGNSHQGEGLVAVFRNQTIWKLQQVLGSSKNDLMFGRAVVVNKNFLVVLGGNYTEITLFSKQLDHNWREETELSKQLSTLASDPTNIHLTDGNELFIVSAKNRSLVVIDLAVSSVSVKFECRHYFSEKLQLSGSLDVLTVDQSVAAVGIMTDGRDGAELVMYEPGAGCVRIGGVLTKTGLRYDDGQPRASIALAEDRVVIGTPGTSTWPTDHVDAGTGRVYLSTLCPRNFVRRKDLDFEHQKEVVCVACGEGEESYPGFEERCVNCSRSICVKSSESLSFKVSHCERYPCGVDKTRSIVQNIARDHLTVTEVAPAYPEDDTFYLPGSEQSYFIRISRLSAVGVETISDGVPFSVDNTSPEPGYVYDGIGSDESHNCSANTTFSSEHQCSTRSFSDTDLDFTNNTAEISARWIDFRDNESDIQSYFWCVGSTPLSDDILGCENVTDHPNKTLSGLSLQHNDTYYVTVMTCNYAGLCTAKSSDGVLIDTTPPVIHYVRDGLIGPDIDFQVFTNMIFGNWAAEDPESGVVSFEVGWGSSPGLDDVWEFQELGNAPAWYARFKHGDLVKGKKYYVTVRAINGAGLESEAMSSNGIVVGKTEFVFSKNDSGSFFFDTVNVNSNESMEDSGIGNTFGTLDVPAGAVDEEVKFRAYSMSQEELKNGTVDDTSVVDPQVTKPPKHFKLGNYSFQIKAYDAKTNTLQSEYHFKKPITISMFYDVDQMLNGNKKTVSNEVTKQDIDPVLLLWDSKNKTWFDAAKTCPEPWSFVDHEAKMLKVQVCHLTQFALFWSFKAENGIIEFFKENNESAIPPHAVYEQDNSVVYTPERYDKEIIFNVVRRKGSTGTIQAMWDVTFQSAQPRSLVVSPMSGQLKFLEGQWNSFISLQLVSIPQNGEGATMYVSFNNMSGGAMFGNFSSAKIVFSSEVENTKESNFALEVILPAVLGALVLVAIVLVVVYLVIRHRRSKSREDSQGHGDNPTYGSSYNQGLERDGHAIAETAFNGH